MAKVLVLFFHPGQRHSSVNLELAKVARAAAGVTFADVYAEYPTFAINIDAEQARLLEHDIIVFQFPVYWYSTPSLMKEWQDLVLEYGFAYGQGGAKLAGKAFFPVVTAGGAAEAYSETGKNHFSLRTLFSPLEQTANLCQMRFMPPFVLFSAQHLDSDPRISRHALAYKGLLEALRDDRFDYEKSSRQSLLLTDTVPVLEP